MPGKQNSDRPRIRPATSNEWDKQPTADGADFDRSTYYEYLEAHTGEHALQGNYPVSAGSAQTARTGHTGSQAYASRQPHGPAQTATPAGASYPAFNGLPPGTPQYPGPPLGGAPSGPVPTGANTGGLPPYPGAGVGSGAGSGAAPGGTSRKRPGMVILGIVAGAVVVALLVVFGLMTLAPNKGVEPSQVPGAGSASTRDAGGLTSGPPGGSAEAKSTSAELNDYVQSGTRTAMSSLNDSWVVQLSAKQEGLQTEGKTWTKDDILAEFESNKSTHPSALLLWSGDWSSFRFDDYWVTVLNKAYAKPEDALATCKKLKLDRDHCFAKKLSTTEGPDKTTKLND